MDILLFKPWFLTKDYMIFKYGVFSAHYNYICILVVTTLRKATWVAETCSWLRCNKITFLHPGAFVGLIKKLYILLMTGRGNIKTTLI